MKLTVAVLLPLASFICACQTHAFAVRPRRTALAINGLPAVSRSHLSMSISEVTVSRGAWVERVVGAALFAVSVGKPTPVLAELGVGEGGLPDGARQFSNLVKIQKDWIALGKTISARGSELSPEEWKNVAFFLRRVYQTGDDLNFLAGGLDPTKKKTALSLVKGIQTEVEAADKPVKVQDVEKFLEAQVSVQGKLETFMDLFADVPDEL